MDALAQKKIAEAKQHITDAEKRSFIESFKKRVLKKELMYSVCWKAWKHRCLSESQISIRLRIRTLKLALVFE